MGESERPPGLRSTCPHGRPSNDGSCIYCRLDPVSGEALHVEGKDAAEVGSLLSQLGKGVPASSDSDESEGFSYGVRRGGEQESSWSGSPGSPVQSQGSWHYSASRWRRRIGPSASSSPKPSSYVGKQVLSADWLLDCP
jgi:hypothetical protein